MVSLSRQQFRAELARRAENVQDEFDFLTKMLGLLCELRDECGIASYTLYVRDPITGELRLEQMHGIRHTEPLDGFILSLDEEQRLIGDTGPTSYQERTYFSDPRQATLLGRGIVTTDVHPNVRELFTQRRWLAYGDFVDREGVVSCVRYEHIVTNRLEAVFFVNFDRQISLDSDIELTGILDDTFENIRSHLDDLHRKADHEYPKALRQIVKILHPIRELATHEKKTTDKSFFSNVLSSVMAAMNITAGEGFGTIHVFHQHTSEAILELYADTIPDSSLCRVINAMEGRGVVSWVALHRKPVLIINMTTSIFDDIRIKHPEFDNIRSEVAVPMQVGRDLIGVLNVESRNPCAFSRQDVHTLWYAATEAALAYTFCNNVIRAKQSEQRVSELLEIAYKAANTGARDDSLPTALAHLLKGWVHADFVEIWMFDDITREFSHAGATYPDFKRNVSPRPEGKGMSRFVVKRQIPVWVSAISSEGEYDCEYWDAHSLIWGDDYLGSDSPGIAMPPSVNPVVLEERITAEIGVPIIAHRRGIGLIWLKYNRPNVCRPLPGEMVLITKVASQIAIVIDSMLQSEQREENEARDALVHEYFDVGRQSKRGMQGFVLYKPCHGKLGGDFCVSIAKEEASWAYLLGDVEGHGYKATIRMLPLITAFRLFQRESQSPNYVLQQLRRVNEKEVYATALCFAYFEQEENHGRPRSTNVRRFVKAASAGHQSLMVLRNGIIRVADLPASDGPAQTRPLSGAPAEGFGEECIEVFTGDLLIGYTDGVEDTTDAAGEEHFGRERIAATVLLNRKRSPEEISQAIFEQVKAFSNNRLGDDITIVVVRIEDPDGSVVY